jgi:hypothetical protein
MRVVAVCMVLIISLVGPATAQDTSEKAIEASIAKLRSPDSSISGDELSRLMYQGAAAGPVFIAIYHRAPDLRSRLLQRACIPGKTSEAAIVLIDSLGKDALAPVVDVALDTTGRLDCVPMLQRIDADAAGSRLLAELQDSASTHRPRAMYLLSRLHDIRAVEPLRRALTSSVPADRAAAAFALQELNATDAVDDLIHTLQDPREGVRFAALNALAHIKSDRAREAAIAYLKNNQESPSQRDEIARILSSNQDGRIRDAAYWSRPWFDTGNWKPGQWLLLAVAITNVAVVSISVLAAIVFRLIIGERPAGRNVAIAFWVVIGLYPMWYGFQAARVGSILFDVFAVSVAFTLLLCAGLFTLLGKRAVPVRNTVLVVAGALFGGYVLGWVANVIAPLHFSS